MVLKSTMIPAGVFLHSCTSSYNWHPHSRVQGTGSPMTHKLPISCNLAQITTNQEPSSLPTFSLKTDDCRPPQSCLHPLSYTHTLTHTHTQERSVSVGYYGIPRWVRAFPHIPTVFQFALCVLTQLSGKLASLPPILYMQCISTIIYEERLSTVRNVFKRWEWVEVQSEEWLHTE